VYNSCVDVIVRQRTGTDRASLRAVVKRQAAGGLLPGVRSASPRPAARPTIGGRRTSGRTGELCLVLSR